MNLCAPQIAAGTMSSSGGGSVSMEDQTYCLKWNNHQSNLLGLFARLFTSEQFTDVVVTAEGRSVRAHKVSERREYLGKILPNFKSSERETTFKIKCLTFYCKL